MDHPEAPPLEGGAIIEILRGMQALIGGLGLTHGRKLSARGGGNSRAGGKGRL